MHIREKQKKTNSTLCSSPAIPVFWDRQIIMFPNPPITSLQIPFHISFSPSSLAPVLSNGVFAVSGIIIPKILKEN